MNANFEIVGYVQAGELDAPLGLVKDAQPVILHRNWQGLFTSGTDLSGNHVTCQPGQTQQNNGCNECSWPGIEWNTKNQFVDARKVQVWLGSLPKGQQDRTGLIYRRNRYYDSGSGQFTQADPIGIAGGVNLYGYANADPVTFSDPFGLRACLDDDEVCQDLVIRLQEAGLTEAAKAFEMYDEGRVFLVYDETHAMLSGGDWTGGLYDTTGKWGPAGNVYLNASPAHGAGDQLLSAFHEGALHLPTGRHWSHDRANERYQSQIDHIRAERDAYRLLPAHLQATAVRHRRRFLDRRLSP